MLQQFQHAASFAVLAALSNPLSWAGIAMGIVLATFRAPWVLAIVGAAAFFGVLSQVMAPIPTMPEAHYYVAAAASVILVAAFFATRMFVPRS